MKWILAIAVVALAIGVFVLQRNTVRVTYVNGLDAYQHLPGTEYIFEQDCYIFKFRDSDTSWPLVGSHQTVPELPETVDAKNVGVDLPDVRILDTAKIGDRFRLVSVRRDESRTGTRITFEILFLDEDSRNYPRLDAYWMMDHSPEQRGEAPSILVSYAAPVFAITPR